MRAAGSRLGQVYFGVDLRKDFSHAGNDNEIHHYAFLKRDSLYGNDDVNKNKNHFVTVEEQLESIGVGVIWFERFDEIPQMIRQIISPLRLIG